MEATTSSLTEEQMQQRRRAFAAQISRQWEVTTTVIDTEKATIEYNEITRTLLALGDRRADPLSTFPVEIWLQIINETLHTSPITFRSRMRTLLHLTAVSTRWRCLVTSEPSLWTQIDTCYTKEDSIRDLTSLVEICIQRSQNAQISVTGSFDDEWAKGVGSGILPHMKRINKIVYISSSGSYLLKSTRLHLLFPTTPALKSLVVMDLKDTQRLPRLRGIEEFVQQNPQLTDIQGVYDGMLQPDSHPELSTATLICEATRIVPLLQTLPKLRDVSFCAIWSHPEAHPFNNVPLPWARMAYKQRNCGAGIRLLGQLRSNLHELHFRVDAPHIRKFMETLQYLKALEKLTIELDIEELSQSLLTSLVDDLPTGHSNVRQVNICVANSLVQSLLERRFTGNPIGFWDWILVCVPNTEALTLPFVYQSQMISLACLPNLRQFCCQTLIRYRLHQIGRCSDLQELTISCATLTFQMLASASVQKLDVTFAETHPIVFSGTKWPRLTVLYLRLAFDFTSEPIAFDLPNLREITVNGKLQTVTTVTNYLAYHQYKVPCLYHISFPNWYPEMDILFILLERRLLSANHESHTMGKWPLSPILEPVTRITISKAIPLHILSLLVDRVQGLLTSRPALVELSVEARAEKVLDADIVGCHFCRTLGVPCGSKVLGAFSRAERKRYLSDYLSYMFYYPPGPTEVLRNWPERARFTKSLRVCPFRQVICSERSSEGCITLDRHSVIDAQAVKNKRVASRLFARLQLFE